MTLVTENGLQHHNTFLRSQFAAMLKYFNIAILVDLFNVYDLLCKHDLPNYSETTSAEK